MIQQDKLAQAITEWRQAGYGCKTDVVNRWAEVFGVDHDTLYRHIRRARPATSIRKARADRGKRMNENIEEWTRQIWRVKLRPPEDVGVLATDQAVQIAVNEGIIPEAALQTPVATYNRIARELKIKPGVKRYVRFQAKYPNLVHQFDASSSKYLYVARRLPDGERILKLHRPAQYYKNKPVPIRERPWVYGITDDYSGYHLCRYTTAEGESAADGVLFLQYAWGKKENPRIPFRGLPRMIYMDNGPLAKAAPIKDFLTRLDITIVPRQPYNKQAGGKIERPWCSLWGRFEKTFFGVDNWKDFEITLTELNRQLNNYLIEENSRPHRQQKGITREQAWLTINLRGGVVDIPPQALTTIFQRHPRTVDGGYFTFENQQYEVPGLIKGKVWVYEGVFDDRLIVEDMQTQTKYEVKLSEPLSFGQRIELVKTEAEKLAEESREQLTITDTYYSEAKETKVINMPVRGEERKLVDPLAVPPAREELTSSRPEEQLFESERERYEFLLQSKCAGDKLAEADIKFMQEFEKSELYEQLAETYQRLESFWQQRRAS
jgi:transposase InsO family protein